MRRQKSQGLQLNFYFVVFKTLKVKSIVRKAGRACVSPNCRQRVDVTRDSPLRHHCAPRNPLAVTDYLRQWPFGRFCEVKRLLNDGARAYFGLNVTFEPCYSTSSVGCCPVSSVSMSLRRFVGEKMRCCSDSGNLAVSQ